VSFTWQYVILRPAPFTWHKGWKFNSKFWRGVLFQWLGKALWFWNNLVEISTVSTYSILSFCINCHFCFLI
jgi:hypothetical protein